MNVIPLLVELRACEAGVERGQEFHVRGSFYRELREEIERLTAERDECNELYIAEGRRRRELSAERDLILANLHNRLADVDHLRQALRDYGQHQMAACRDLPATETQFCHCGLTAALWRVSSETKAPQPGEAHSSNAVAGGLTPAMCVERAYQMLETLGVPRERARDVANGIDVLATRYRKAEIADRAEIDRLRAALEYLGRAFELAEDQTDCGITWREAMRQPVETKAPQPGEAHSSKERSR